MCDWELSGGIGLLCCSHSQWTLLSFFLRLTGFFCGVAASCCCFFALLCFSSPRLVISSGGRGREELGSDKRGKEAK